MMDNLELESDSENQFSDDDNKNEPESSEYENSSHNSDNNESDDGNTGWANSMAKILKSKPKSHKSVVLSKSKKLNEIQIKQEKKYDFQIEGETKPNIKEEEIKNEKLPLGLDEKKDIKLKISRQKARQNMRICRVKPALADRERERAFKKIATKGVVQLFNAVKTQQKVISQKLEAAGRLDHRRERVLNSLDKRAFLDVLMGGARAKSELVDNPVKDEVKNEDSDDDENESPIKKKKSWEIFKPDFLVNKKLTNWDKNQDSDEEVNEDDRGNMELDSDDQNSS